MIIFLSGPVTLGGTSDTATIRHRQGVFEVVAREYERDAHFVLNPARLPLGHDHDWYMSRCMKAMERADVVVLLPGWRESAGAVREYERAAELGMEIVERGER